MIHTLANHIALSARQRTSSLTRGSHYGWAILCPYPP